jgi:hypothetical protein
MAVTLGRGLMGLRIMSVQSSAPMSVDRARNPLAPPITLEHVTAPSPRFGGKGEVHPPPAVYEFLDLICPSVL